MFLFAVGCSRDAESGPGEAVLRFTAIPDQNTTRLKEKFGPVAEYLSATLGVKCEYVASTKYSASVEMFKNGDVDLAWFGGLTGVQARAAVPGATAIAQGAEDPEFYSYFIAHKDTGLERSDTFPDIAGKKFTFGSDSSTSGRLMPEFFIRKHTGKSPQELFGAANSYANGHDQTAELVASGQFHVGVLNYKVYDRRVEEGKTDPSVCKIIWKTPVYADYNFTAHPGIEKKFGAGFTQKLQKALLDMKDEKLLSAFPRKSLIAAKNEDFQAIVDVATQLNMLR